MSLRTPTHAIAPVFAERWSPRAFAATPITLDQLNVLFEAARWAPSAYNAQPWRFVYALRDDAHWQALLELLLPFNQRWAAQASALVFVVSKTTFQAPGKEVAPFPSHAFDTGAAWVSLALQARHEGLVTHAMGGFDRDRARDVLQLPADYELQAAVAIGYQGAAESLPDDLRSREQPSPRQPLSELVFAGRFG
jgi:nitroreductase